MLEEKEILNDYYKETDEKKKIEFFAIFEEGSETYLELLLNENENLKQAVYALANLTKKQKCSDFVSYFLKKKDIVTKFAHSEDSKVRKNCYIMLGNLKNKAYVTLLENALIHEKTFFCLPSLILALGSIGANNIAEKLAEFKKSIENITDPALTSKQRTDIYDAILKASNKNSRTVTHFEGYLLGQLLLLTTLEGAKSFLKERLSRLKVEIIKEIPEGIVIKYNGEDLRQVRCYYELYLYYADLYEKNEEQTITNLLTKLDASYFARMFVMNKAINYRISLNTRENLSYKRNFINKIVKQIENNCPCFINNPYDYGFEIIINEFKGEFVTFIKLSANKDTRFTYRKNMLPASINPVTANIIAEYAKNYVNKSSTVCDAFCGTGTMLIELNNLVSVKKLIGVDIFVQAITYAKENCKLASCDVTFIAADITKVDNLSDVNLILSNMPFGNRVGNHEINEELYFDFFKKAQSFMNKGGHLCLYTTEIDLLRQCISRNSCFSLIKQIKLESGGMTPSLFIIAIK